MSVADPRRLYELRLEAARAEARRRVQGALGEPATPAERKRFDEEVRALVEQWTRGWDGSGLGSGAAPPVARRRWWGRLRGALGRGAAGRRR